MACSCSCFGNTAEQHFTPNVAAKDLQRYRHKGIGPTTRLLRDGLAKAGLIEGALLDIGAGVGALTFELLDLGISRAVVVEASSAYVAVCAKEAARRSRAEAIEFVHGDFLSLAEQLPRVALVTLDRVICCYPSYEPFLEQALRRAEVGFALSYPRDRWYVRVAVWLENAMRSRKSSFRTFVHPAARMQQIIERAGFELVSRRCTVAWSADVLVRRGPRSGADTRSTPGPHRSPPVPHDI